MLWIGTEGGGVSKLDPRTDTFTQYQSNPTDPNSISGDRVFNLFQDGQGLMWFSGPSAMGLHRLDPATNAITRYGGQSNRPMRGGVVRNMLETADGALWLMAESLLLRYDPTADDFVYFEPPAVQSNRFNGMLADDDGVLWIGGTQGLYRFDPRQSRFTHYPDLPSINDLIVIDGVLWLGTNEGVVWKAPSARGACFILICRRDRRGLRLPPS
jgi:streptogramin lyase